MLSSMAKPLWLMAFFVFKIGSTLEIDLNDDASIKTGAGAIAQNLLANHTLRPHSDGVGLFGQAYYWWESGAIWSGLIDYWNYTGDAQYNNIIEEALLAQVGPNNDYMVPNQTKTEGNDDQAIWALAAMTAAEQQLPAPSGNASWLDLAKNVFDLQVARWDTKTCGGGLRWQIYTFNDGYDYKNSQSSGFFFQLAARLARYTGNQTYADWAIQSYDWSSSVGLISKEFRVYDGTLVSQNCTSIDKLQWTYTAATFVYGSAVMYNFTNGDSLWLNRTQSLLSAMSIFFTGSNSSSSISDIKDKGSSNVMVEIACEPEDTCQYDQYLYKGLAAQWLGATTQFARFTAHTISPYLSDSAAGAAGQCSGGSNHTSCGFLWTDSTFDGNTGLEQQLGALNVIVANLAINSSAPVTINTTSIQPSSSTSATRPMGNSTTTTPKGTTATSNKPSSDSLKMLPCCAVAWIVFFTIIASEWLS